jgi:hypothetical protein
MPAKDAKTTKMSFWATVVKKRNCVTVPQRGRVQSHPHIPDRAAIDDHDHRAQDSQQIAATRDFSLDSWKLVERRVRSANDAHLSLFDDNGERGLCCGQLGA